MQFAEVQPETSPQVAAVTGADAVGASATTLVLEATARSGGEEVPLVVSVRDMDGGLWQPSISAGDPADAATGIVLSEVAARDLGVAPGDRIMLEHPQRTAQGATQVTTPIVVAGTHPGPIRAVSYLDRSQAAAFGAAGLVNSVEVTPADGVTRDELTRALFDVPGVASVQAATAVTDSFRGALDAFTGILGIAAAITLLLALLIAFNATSIATDERAREHATMFAFGLPRRAVVAMAMTENAADRPPGHRHRGGAGLPAHPVHGGGAAAPDPARVRDAGQRLARHGRRRARRRGGGGRADPAAHGAPSGPHGHPGDAARGRVATRPQRPPPLRVSPVECFEVTGGTALTGRVRVTGAKNSALKLMAAALLAAGPTTIDEVPDILDVSIMSEVLRRLGCEVTYERTRRQRRRRPGRRRRAREAVHRDRLRPGAPDAGVDQRARAAGRPLRHRAGRAARWRRHRLPRPGHAHLRPGAARARRSSASTASSSRPRPG